MMCYLKDKWLPYILWDDNLAEVISGAVAHRLLQFNATLPTMG